VLAWNTGPADGAAVGLTAAPAGELAAGAVADVGDAAGAEVPCDGAGAGAGDAGCCPVPQPAAAKLTATAEAANTAAARVRRHRAGRREKDVISDHPDIARVSPATVGGR
jgi:hypothetical protein